MDSRGRSRDVSPIALVRATLDDDQVARISLAYVAQPMLYKSPQRYAPAPHNVKQTHEPSPQMHRPRHTMYETDNQPVASSSRLDVIPALSPSHTSSTSSSLEQTPATPSESSDDIYQTRYSPERSLDYYESPPSPPRTLQDQMQVAYALDNMHLAKVLFLKLKGIEVTDDDDPRIEQVKDEDFSETFVPRGGLRLTEEDERRCIEGQRRDYERRRRKAREERLKVCERIWENSARNYREAKAKAVRKKEAEARIRRLADLEARERDRERTKRRERALDIPRQARTMRTTCGTTRPVLSYDTLPALNSRAQLSTSQSPPKSILSEPVYEYTLMRPTSTDSLDSLPRSKPASPNTAYRSLRAKDDKHIPFADIISSMQGPLFPDEDDDGLRRVQKGKTLAQVKLLDTLLEPVRWDPAEREGKPLSQVKARAEVKECLGCSDESTSVSETSINSSPSSAPTRSISWFSFGSRSSVSTTITTPSASPMAIKTFQPLPHAGRESSRHLPTRAKHSCRHVRMARNAPLPLQSVDNPLYSPAVQRSSVEVPTRGLYVARGRTLTRSSKSAGSRSSSLDPAMLFSSDGVIARMGRSVMSMVDMAAQLQRAYVKATMYTASPDIYFRTSDSSPSRSRSRRRSRTRSVTPVGRRRERGTRLRPQGYRATLNDVSSFTSPDLSTLVPTPERPLIPLHNARPASAGAGTSDIPRVFPAPAPVPRSPFRPAHPPTTLTSRLRPISNPLLWRLRALQNVCGVEKDALDVKEKVVGIAWECIGRSGLTREVKPAATTVSLPTIYVY